MQLEKEVKKEEKIDQKEILNRINRINFMDFVSISLQ